MAINTDNDEVHVYQDAQGEYRWRRVDTGNGRIVSNGGQGYVAQNYAWQAAEAYNSGVPVRASS